MMFIFQSEIKLSGRTIIERDASEFGKYPSLVSFVGNHVTVRRADGSLIATAVTPYPAVIYNNAISNRWNDATRYFHEFL